MTRVAFTLIVSTVLLGSFAAVGKTQVRHFEPVTNDELLHPEDPGGVSPGEMPGRCSPTTCSDQVRAT